MFAVGAWAEEPLSGEYVDLGLSVKWATCNLGATSSTDAGWYLAWGETSAKTNYTWETYLSDLGGTMTEWSDAGTNKDPLKEYVYGGSHSEGIGGTAYDAATAALGTGYRMPTQTEFAELANTSNCTWEWYAKDNTEFNGVAGYKVTSKKEGFTDKFIFLPAAGCRSGVDLYDEGSDGYYWSSAPCSGDADGAYDPYFDSGNVRPNSGYGRCYGLPVRPVCDAQDPAQAAYDYLVSLIGDKTYEKDDIALFINEDGELQIDFGERDIEVYSSDVLSVSDNLYIFEIPQVFPKIKIVLESGNIAHIYAMAGDEIIFEFIENVSGTPTAIDAVDAAKFLKTIKTIENGRIVIIRGDKKYDLSGREL